LLAAFKAAKVAGTTGGFRSRVGNVNAGETQVVDVTRKDGNVRVGFDPQKRQTGKPKVQIKGAIPAELNRIPRGGKGRA
jgi:hypothetical protein